MTNPTMKDLDDLLKESGGFYSAEDVINSIHSGQMQGFLRGGSWAVTQIVNYPQITVLDIIIVMGNLGDCVSVHEDIVDFAKEHNIDKIRSMSRSGWEKHLISGWKKQSTVYMMDL